MSSITPGPWEAGDWHIYAGNRAIAAVFRQTEEDEANARAIAAVPEMMEMLKYILFHTPRDGLPIKFGADLANLLTRIEGKEV